MKIIIKKFHHGQCLLQTPGADVGAWTPTEEMDG